MARLNISIPSDLAPLVSKWRRKINLSEICAAALRSELAAVESHRSALPLLRKLRRPTGLEQELAERFHLQESWVMTEEVKDEHQIREGLGALAADYLNRSLTHGSVLALGGGRQSWCVAEHMSPRQLEVDIVALGYRQADQHLINAHPNTLITILWLLFSPKARAWLIGSDLKELFGSASTNAASARYFVVGSCAPFERDSGLARLLGAEATRSLFAQNVAGDFLYNFFAKDGKLIDLKFSAECSVLTSNELLSLSKRPDAKVVLVAGGRRKAETIRKTLEAELCNVLITDSGTGEWLLRNSSAARG
jgi:DNA-binding transcriptional regulator LsrR (DeoR family)